MGGFAWVTLATNDSYSLGALVLAHSLKAAGTAHQLAVLVTPGVTNAMREKLSSVFNLVQEVNVLDSRDETNLRLLKRPELGITFTKLHCWRLTQYEKCVFLDADTLVMQHCDELFEREELSAAPDVGWPDCFNSGVFVYRPSLETYEKLIQFALEKGSFDGGDQGLLNLFFSDWAHKDISKHLPFIYNMCSTACYSYLPAFKQFGANAKIIHFIGAQKPWLQYFNTETRQVQPSGDSAHLQEVLQRWWDIFCSLIHPHLSPAMAGLAGAFAQLTLGVPRTAEQDAFENVLRKQAWEVGNIDYLGKDAFDNIWSKITETLQAAPEPIVTAPEAEPSAPAQSQSQSASQKEKIEPVPTIDPTTDNTSKIDSSQVTPVVETLKEQAEAPQVGLEPPSTPSTQEPVETVKPEPKVAAKEAETQPAAIDNKTPDSVGSQPQALPEIPPASKDQGVVEPGSCPAPEPKDTKKEETKVLEKELSQEVAACPITQKTETEPVPVEPTAKTILEPVCPLPQPKKEDKEAPTLEVLKQEVPTLKAQELSAPKLEETPQAPSLVKEAPKATSQVPEPTLQSKDSEAKETSKASEPIALATSPTPEQVAQPLAQPTEPSKKPEELTDKTTGTTEPSERAVASVATQPAASATESKIAAKVTPKETAKASEPAVPSSPTPKDAPKAAGSKATAKDSPKTKVTEATPPATPSSPTVEKTKQALAAEAEIPETPPPSEGGSTPTPPPRKTDKPKKAAAKPKK